MSMIVSEDKICLKKYDMGVEFEVGGDRYYISVLEDFVDWKCIGVSKEEWREFVVGMIEIMSEEDREEIVKRVRRMMR